MTKQNPPKPIIDTDVLIVGAGPVGMALANLLRQSPLKICLIDRHPRKAWEHDLRALALSQGSRQLLEKIACWPHANATAIDSILVSQKGAIGQATINAKDYNIPSLGYVVRYPELATRLDERLTSQVLTPYVLHAISHQTTHVAAHVTATDETSSALQINAKLLVHAEGSPEDSDAFFVRDYGQTAIVCEVSAAAPHRNRAWERFTPEGPLALLPAGEGYALVWTMPPERAAQILATDEVQFIRLLNERLNGRLTLLSATRRASFPLKLKLRKQLTQAREVWLGNTAQTLHPVSGQGFNLGLRDAAELANALLTATDPGERSVLTRYAQGRQTDRIGSAVFTHGIVSLFSNDNRLLSPLRGMGLLALDTFPPLKRFVAQRMIWGARRWL